jgi:hypothetical protein
MRRRILFFCRYLSAKAHSKTIVDLLPIVESSFDHPWVAGVEMEIRFWPGRETRFERWWRTYKSLPKQSMSWDAPVAISVLRKRKGKKRQALCLSMYVSGGTLYIGQLQGVLGTDPPDELRPWAKIFIGACRTFVRQKRMREVRIPRANSLYSYRNPHVSPNLLPDARINILRRIRRDMELLYDANALDLGFVPDGEWFSWKNPGCADDRSAPNAR